MIINPKTPLGTLDPNAPRQQLKDRICGDAKKLASRSAKYLSMSAEYAERRAYEKKRLEKEPSYAQRLNALAPRTRRLPCLPFESGRNVLPGMEGFLK